MAASTSATRGAKDLLKNFLERVERLEEEKKNLQEDIKSVYQEFKAQGFDTKALRAIVRMRKQDSNERAEQEAILQTYMHALGMDLDQPLFAAVGAMSVDIAARDQVIAAFKQLVPATGEVVVKMGGAPVRLYRDKDGQAQVEEVTETAAEPPMRPGKKLKEPATVLTMVPKGSPSPEEIKRIADDAERVSDAKKGKGSPADAPKEPDGAAPA